MSLALQLPSSLTVGPLAPYKKLRVTFMYRTCVNGDSTIWFFVLFYFTLVAEPTSSASGLDRSTQQGELRSSAMSEDEQVPQFYGRIDEKIAEWESDVRLWQVEFKVEDRDRLDQGCIGEVCTDSRNHCENKARNTRCCTILSGQHQSMLGQEALDNYFDMRQGKVKKFSLLFCRRTQPLILMRKFEDTG